VKVEALVRYGCEDKMTFSFLRPGFGLMERIKTEFVQTVDNIRMTTPNKMEGENKQGTTIFTVIVDANPTRHRNRQNIDNR
jgi:hypothetical protein